jgi:hypothetical protein
MMEMPRGARVRPHDWDHADDKDGEDSNENDFRYLCAHNSYEHD